jgi:hypothetical protein
LDAPFKPTLINSAVFLISSTMHVSTFAVNYRGHPFMQSLWENKPLLYCLAAVGCITAMAASQVSPEITAMLELVPFSDEVSSSPETPLRANPHQVPQFVACGDGGGLCGSLRLGPPYERLIWSIIFKSKETHHFMNQEVNGF